MSEQMAGQPMPRHHRVHPSQNFAAAAGQHDGHSEWQTGHSSASAFQNPEAEVRSPPSNVELPCFRQDCLPSREFHEDHAQQTMFNGTPMGSGSCLPGVCSSAGWRRDNVIRDAKVNRWSQTAKTIRAAMEFPAQAVLCLGEGHD